VVVKERTDSAVSLLATGFARQANVDFTVTVGGCTGRSSMVATADALIAQFAITPSCAGGDGDGEGGRAVGHHVVRDRQPERRRHGRADASGEAARAPSGGTAAASTAPAATDTARRAGER
jgi:hypothetical protein